MSSSFLDYLFHSACRTRALLFSPFSTMDVLYDEIEQLLQSCGFNSAAVPVFEADINETERVMVFAHTIVKDELKNLGSVLKGLKVEVSDRRFCYSLALFVVVERLSGIPVDVEHRHCAWASCEYSIGGGPDFFSSSPSDFMLNAHRMLRVCKCCSEAKVACKKDGVGDCERCVQLGVECAAGPGEAQERRVRMYRLVKNELLHTLNAVHQYVIVTHSRRLKDNIMAAARVEQLQTHVLTNTLPSWNFELEAQLKHYADGFQSVVMENGIIKIDQEKQMDEWWGYEMQMNHMKKEELRSLVSPHLGMYRPEEAVLFIDHAMRKPGELFFRDDCILNKAFEPVSVRIMVLVAVIAPACIRVTLGWKKP